MSLLSRLQEAQGRNPDVRVRGCSIESVREAIRLRLLAKDKGWERISCDDELATLWAEPLEAVARGERLENLGGYAPGALG